MNVARKKFNLLTIEYPLYFAIVIIVTTFAFFVMLTDSFKSYESNLEILFIPKSEKLAVQAELITNNMSLLPKNLSFYEKMLRDNPRIEDKFSGLEKDAKKKAWGNIISVSVREKSTIITVKANSLSAEETTQLSRQIAYTLFDYYSQYYSVKDDIDLRIVDGPITKTQYQWLTLALSSIFLGLIFSLVIYAAIFNVLMELIKIPTVPRLAFGLPIMPTIQNREVEEILPPENIIDDQSDFAKKTFEVKFKKAEAPENLPIVQEEFIAQEKFCVPNNLPIAPANLPVAEPTPIELPVMPAEPPVIIEKTEAESVVEAASLVQEEIEEKGEPNKEEYKRRLNQLLRGEI